MKTKIKRLLCDEKKIMRSSRSIDEAVSLMREKYVDIDIRWDSKDNMLSRLINANFCVVKGGKYKFDKNISLLIEYATVSNMPESILIILNKEVAEEESIELLVG